VLGVAADVLSSAFALGRHSEGADAATFVLDQGSKATPQLRTLASVILNREPGPERAFADEGETPDTIDATRVARVGIRTTRERLRGYPRNALVWMDLARHYSTLGLSKRAVRAMSVALALAPDHRLTLRAATRLHVHNDAPDEAVWLLRRSPTTQSDPWLVAAEIAASMVAEKSPRFAKHGRQLLKSGKFHPFHTGELAAALGSMELEEGATRVGRKLFEAALREPTENTVAQAEWASRTMKLQLIEPRHLDVPHSYEARAREHYEFGRWSDVLDQTWRWFQDEPFSSRPALLGCYVTSVILADWDAADQFARFGLVANPDDQMLLNNRAFALASADRVQEAIRMYNRMTPGKLNDDQQRAVWLATGGLIQYRLGNPVEGRRLYNEAIELSRRSGHTSQAALALGLLAREELRVGMPGAEVLLAAAEAAAREHPRHGLPALVQRIRAGIQREGINTAAPPVHAADTPRR
jgi:tetratricopeptide (TPR) repeat protein